jgi:1-acyl-sn-glycerol-3-phosphate acyltransferase
LLYAVLRVHVRLCLWICCPEIRVNRPDLLRTAGPVLIAANHPNSFLDAVIVDVLFQRPVWSLARGDVFKGKMIRRILHAVKILPVYRRSEGVENLQENYRTFDDCIRLFENGEQVLIFSEGKCINEWHLRPLLKGTARLAFQAWDRGIPLTVLPAGINYDSFRSFGKIVEIGLGDPIQALSASPDLSDGKRLQDFNRQLQQQLALHVKEIVPPDKEKAKALFKRPLPGWQRLALLLPAATGALLHLPVFLLSHFLTQKYFANNDHYDSIQLSIIILGYPVYLLIVLLLALFLAPWPWFLCIILMPLLARAAVVFYKKAG